MYELWVMGEDTPFYVGKGTRANRPYRHLSLARNGDMSLKSKKIRKAWSMNLPIIIKRVFRADTNEEVLEEEKRLIALYGRRNNGTGVLVNFTDGGEGVSGYIASEEAKLKISAVKKGKQYRLGKLHSKESKLKMSIAAKKRKPVLGRICSEETRLRMSAAQKGNKKGLGHHHSEESKLKISIAAKNRIRKPQSKEQRENLSIRLKGNKYRLGKKLSKEHIQKISDGNKGQKRPEKIRLKMRKSQLIRYQTQRNLITIYKILGINEGD